ncbi:MAG: Holliday junction ATP-dependent DNA helicase RuvA [Candidatus Omnitrophica bacterium ADurb.Bin292]|nr:MAG: Holliday junction ATP-dependent DNA helicase RuvA [Candidatus Omnitrophica bacterium ADurb.Bin292]HOG23411.1 Holliday junction branch migration protein RuvA [Candidatus Omnitrophota bacterium]HPW77297.1 Holliday junction branch migration protein RuvA [Candidatus Omnitrophota bacterium]HQB11784.1 Holliday junction branch migration protein RuvA [Candidatus Omnitrophota bacterium]
MYYFLNGKIVEKTPAVAILDVNGIGYEVRISVNTFSALPDLGQSVKLLTHFVVREDAQLLYGFATEEERDLFRLLLSVSGIGPKTALTLLSGMTISELKTAILDGSIAVLSSITGIGKKTAERVIVELRDKLTRGAGKDSKDIVHDMNVSDSAVEDAIQALVALGYTKLKAKEVTQRVLKDGLGKKLSVEDIIRKALKHV